VAALGGNKNDIKFPPKKPGYWPGFFVGTVIIGALPFQKVVFISRIGLGWFYPEHHIQPFRLGRILRLVVVF